jgi:hypothetical protein
MGFLSALSNAINDQFGVGENTTHSLDQNGVPYGALGTNRETNVGFADRIDNTAERTYLENGFVRNIRPRIREVLFQQPDITVVFKKRLFSSLATNTRQDVMEEKERIFLAASKRLFQNKCRVISAYEKLTKVEQVVKESKQFNTYLAPMILNAVDTINLMGIPFDADVKIAIDKLRKIMSYSDPGEVSNWTTNDWDSVFNDKLGEGPGTFELTNISGFSSNVGLDWASGSASLTIEDPYNLMTITESDIDQALSDVANPFKSLRFGKFTEIQLNNTIADLKEQLAVKRGARNASQITFMTSEGTFLSSRVRAVVDQIGTEVIFQYSTGVQNALKGIEDAKDGTWQAFNSSFDLFTPGTVNIDANFIAKKSEANSSTYKLTSDEAKLFSSIICAIYTLFGFHATSQKQILKTNKTLNYPRNRMRMMFNGKNIIQSMDVINIFLTTRTSEDQKLTSDFRSARTTGSVGFNVARKFDTMLKSVNDGIINLTESFSFTGAAFAEDYERKAIVGEKFPLWLWNLFRNDITKQSAGTAVFVGLVKDCKSTFSDGKYTVSVSCEDNANYFTKGQINFQPSPDLFYAPLYDPLTPFNVSFDGSTGVAITDPSMGDIPDLLPENKTLILSGAVAFKAGPRKGEMANLNSYRQGSNESVFSDIKKVLYDPDGLVYRWKQGIQTMTYSDRANPASSTEHERSVLLTNKPFAGQDMMNVISLLITGQAYNPYTFLKAALQNGNSLAQTDPATGQPVAISYIIGLMTDLQKNNSLWGNFVPFKKLVMDPSLESFITKTQIDLTQSINSLKTAMSERASIMDEITLLCGKQYTIDQLFSSSATTGMTQNKIKTFKQYADKIKDIDKQIAALSQTYTQTINDPNKSPNNLNITVTGDSIDLNPNLADINPKDNEAQRSIKKLELRKKLAQLTLRRLWQVRANEDPNFFIVDDQYDNNFDLMAFERKLGKIDAIFNSQFGTVGDQIKTVSTILGFEIFANTQGHIEARPPQYNKVPSSVFYKMFQDRAAYGIKVFPSFLENLYYNQMHSLIDQVCIVEDEIRLRGAALGKYTDSDIAKNNIGANFAFVTDENTGKLTSIPSAVLNAYPDMQDQLYDKKLESQGSSVNKEMDAVIKGLKSFSQSISTQAKIQNLFNITQQNVLGKDVTVYESQSISRVDMIRARIMEKTNRSAPTLSELFSNDNFRTSGNISQTDRLNIIQQMSNFISQRQTLLKSLTNVIKNLQEGLAVNKPELSVNPMNQGLGAIGGALTANSETSADKAALNPWLYRKTGIPEPLSHMIEYEDNDDYGINAGKRFVIKGNRIISMTIEEHAPDYTMVGVKGLIGEGFIPGPGSLNTVLDGNVIHTAYAVDYDLWYMYGFRASNTIEIPFFSDPDSQCAPYAYSLLLKARENILIGSVEVNGYNEFYQPGDVVYIEDRNLLFYVKNVSHNLSYGNVTTTLTLTYGHSPGEYIPNMLDVVGKIMYNARGYHGQLGRTARAPTLGAARSMGAVSLQNRHNSALNAIENNAVESFLQSNQDIMDYLFKGPIGERNKGVLANTLVAISGAYNQTGYNRFKTRIRLVFYTDTEDQFSTYSVCKEIKKWLITPGQYSNQSNQFIKQPNKLGINPDDIIIDQIALSTQKVIRKEPALSVVPYEYPFQTASPAACNITRLITDNSAKQVTPDQFRQYLEQNVVDIFVVYNTPEQVPITANNTNSQAGQNSAAAVNSATSRTGTSSSSGTNAALGGIRRSSNGN